MVWWVWQWGLGNRNDKLCCSTCRPVAAVTGSFHQGRGNLHSGCSRGIASWSLWSPGIAGAVSWAGVGSTAREIPCCSSCTSGGRCLGPDSCRARTCPPAASNYPLTVEPSSLGLQGSSVRLSSASLLSTPSILYSWWSEGSFSLAACCRRCLGTAGNPTRRSPLTRSRTPCSSIAAATHSSLPCGCLSHLYFWKIFADRLPTFS